MKINWKIAMAAVILIAAVILGISSVLPRTYKGTELNISVGRGSITVTNPSDLPLSVQLSGTRSFRVSSDIESISGRSTLQSSGRNSIYVLEFVVPSGVSEFSVMEGTGVSFSSATDTTLDVTVQPFNTADTRIRLSVAVIAILGSLFYLSSTNDHRWLSAARRKKAQDQATAQETEQDNFQRILKARGSKKF